MYTEICVAFGELQRLLIFTDSRSEVRRSSAITNEYCPDIQQGKCNGLYLRLNLIFFYFYDFGQKLFKGISTVGVKNFIFY